MDIFGLDPKLASRLQQSSEEELRVLAELGTDQKCDEQAAISIYSSLLLYRKWNGIADLRRAVRYAEAWLADTPLDEPDRGRRDDILKLTEDLDRQCAIADEDGDEDGVEDGDDSSITSTVELDENGLPIEETCNQVMALADHALALYDGFQTTGSLDDLNGAISIMESLVSTRSDYVSEGMQHNYGVMLGSRFETTGSIDDLDQAIRMVRNTVEATQDPESLYEARNNLANFLGQRYEQTGSTDDLNDAINHSDNVVAAVSRDHPRAITFSNDLVVWLVARYERMGSAEDLHRAIDMATDIVSRAPQDHPDRAACLTNLGNALGARFKREDSLDDLNRAISTTREAVDTTPLGHPDRAIRLYNLGNELSWRFHRTGSRDDLDGAIDAASHAIDTIPPNHSYRVVLLNSLSGWLGYRYRSTGSMEDLNRAIDVGVSTVDATPAHHVSRVGNIYGLGIWLRERFLRTGAMGDLNRAIDLAADALDQLPPDHARLARYSADLGNMLSERYRRTLREDDISRATNLLTVAVSNVADDHPDRAAYFHGLSFALGRQSLQDEGPVSNDYLDRAIDMADQAVGAIAPSHPVRKTYLNDLGFWLGARYERAKSTDDLDRAVRVSGQAVDATPSDNPRRASYLKNHALWLGKRAQKNDSWSDLNAQFTCLFECSTLDTATPALRIETASAAADILSAQENWEEVNLLHEDALRLIPSLSPRSLGRADAESLIAQLRGLASAAAASALNAGKGPEHALRLLELGRGVIGGLLMDMRGDVTDLALKHPDLAAVFTSLRDELSASTLEAEVPMGEDMTSWEAQLKRRREADQEFDELVKLIRTKANFSDFLQPPGIETLTSAAARGPVIVLNTTGYRCDAFIIKSDSIQVVELPKLKTKEIRQRAKDLSPSGHKFAALLEWLWEAICRPCLDALGFTDPVLNDDWPHVWWVPTALLCHFPLHAAGIYGKQPGETVMDRVISSYAVSIKALLYGRKNAARAKSHMAQRDGAVIVPMSETPGLLNQGRLPFAQKEVEMLKTVCPSLGLVPMLPEQQRSSLLEALQRCEIFHFAGHGASDSADPLQSHLLLRDWQTAPLTVGDLMDRQLQENPPFLAYLSACSTGAIKKVDLSDEGIHVVSAFQLAGFQHVVGTLWEVLDRQCVDVANCLYKTLQERGVNDDAVGLGLHLALRELRDRGLQKGEETRDAKLMIRKPRKQAVVMRDFHWVPYVHFGG
ncbi:hypothetical protein N3K66_004066 [Trichothecium roseum]|uniref:Uncharacterized protein n=1 Tax=Trichothecium roseum TaxID=47278 RepID=A0ACC0V8V1_9HYPO|nr:hypothetical protein N3K66_004066 [Trichothecium roseum]